MLASPGRQFYAVDRDWSFRHQHTPNDVESVASFYERKSLELTSSPHWRPHARQSRDHHRQLSDGNSPSWFFHKQQEFSASSGAARATAEKDSGRASTPSSSDAFWPRSSPGDTLDRSWEAVAGRINVSRSCGDAARSRRQWSADDSILGEDHSLNSSLSSDAFLSCAGDSASPRAMTKYSPMGSSRNVSAGRASKGRSAVDWLAKHPSNGYVRVHAASAASGGAESGEGTVALTLAASWLVACSTTTEAHAVCSGLSLPASALHVQLNGGVVRRLDAFERPLEIQNAYLRKIGYRDTSRVQLEGLSEDLQYLVKFYAGKPYDYSTYGRRGQVSAVLEVKFAGVLQRWNKRLCILSGTKLTVHKDKTKHGVSAALQMAKGQLEEVSTKGHNLCLKVTSCPPEKVAYLSFEDSDTYAKWSKKLRKATTKSQLSADLSDCNLEFLPEAVFNNDQLTVLNLRRNILRHRPVEEDIYTIGWLEDLSRFASLQSLNLADNCLEDFPAAVCDIKTLVELNLASNKITSVPPSISQLTNLQALHLHNNWLTSIPSEITSLSKLSVLVLAFNKFRHVPAPVAALLDSRVSSCEVLVMAGNEVDSLPVEALVRLRNAAKIDLRMNCLTLPASETMRFGQLERLTHIDVRDNRIAELDLRAVRTLEYVNAERNEMSMLWLCGLRLRTVLAASNELQQFAVSPKPEWLESIDVSRNSLPGLPSWLSTCKLLTSLKASYNKLNKLPERLLSDCKRLRVLRADHNRLKTLGSEAILQETLLEELLVHCNQLECLPKDLLQKCNRLRVLNASSNNLPFLPSSSPGTDACRLQELYLSKNRLKDDCFDTIGQCIRLRVLHLAYNRISCIPDRGISELGLLQDLNISANAIQHLPTSILLRLPQLKVLRAHSNPLCDMPDYKDWKPLTIFEVGEDMQNNDVMVVHDLGCGAPGASTSLSTTGLDRLGSGGGFEEMDGFANGTHKQHVAASHLSRYCEYGFVESAGNRNRLCTGAVHEMPYYRRDEALFGVIDGGRNEEIGSSVKSVLLHAINEERHKDCSEKEPDADQACEYLRHAFLAAHRGLQMTGQKLGASVVVCSVRRRHVGGNVSGYVLEVANCGDAGAVLCRGDSEPMIITRSHAVNEDPLDAWRVFHDDGIIAEDGKVDGVSRVARCLGNSYLYPHVLPEPWLCAEPLQPQDEFLIMANAALWRHMTHTEAVAHARPVIRGGGRALEAARLLRDLGQSYGCTENLCIVVVRFDPSMSTPLPRHTPSTSSLSNTESRTTSMFIAGTRHNNYMDAVYDAQVRTYDDYQNVDELAPRSPKPALPWNAVKKKPLPEPRISLRKMYDSCKLSSLYRPSDYVDFSILDDIVNLEGASESGKTRASAASSETTLGADRSGRESNGNCSTETVAASRGRSKRESASGSSTSSSSRTLTVGSSSSDSWHSCGAWDIKSRSRERRRRDNAERQYGSDTLLQHPSDVEFETSSGYFSRPPMAASSLESCQTENSSAYRREGEGSVDTLQYDDGSTEFLPVIPQPLPCGSDLGSGAASIGSSGSVRFANSRSASKPAITPGLGATFAAERVSPVAFPGTNEPHFYPQNSLKCPSDGAPGEGLNSTDSAAATCQTRDGSQTESGRRIITTLSSPVEAPPDRHAGNLLYASQPTRASPGGSLRSSRNNAMNAERTEMAPAIMKSKPSGLTGSIIRWDRLEGSEV